MDLLLFSGGVGLITVESRSWFVTVQSWSWYDSVKSRNGFVTV